jgi:cyclic dehypoxanthinyl futalosine synthase
MEENVVSAAGGHDRVRVTEREIIRNIADAGFTPAQRNSRFKIIRYPDVKAVLASNPASTGQTGAIPVLEPAVLNSERAVDAAAR